ncbi:hypothetical protein QYM36_010802 [Artemia franciscana]|uniref:FERM domain-containing protein n=2 Tax=Artemia franciscana TaxID=6661 RepID=A0AA88HSH3_ARTSF|nr:hypothetical protein QYM36_010802 [Artemia franciscana]
MKAVNKCCRCLYSMRPAASDPVQTCVQPLPSARKYVAVRLLSGETLFFVVEAKAKVRDLLSAIVRHLGTLGMVSYDLFGLAFLLDGEYLFLEPETKLAKYAPKIWKASHGSGLDAHGNPLLTFHFRVQYYVDNPLFFRDRVTRLHFYLQLRENVVHYSQPCGEETFLLLAALALQADVADYSEEKHRGQYFDLNCYLPNWIIQRLGESYLHQQISNFHRNQRGLTQAGAQLSYIKEASHGDCYHSLHLYRLMHSKRPDKAESARERGIYIPRTMIPSMDSNLQPTTSVWLGIATRGVDIYEANENQLKALKAGLLWHSIKNLSFERRKFELRAECENKKFTYYASSDVKCKHLLYLCQATHQFSMKIAEDVRNAKDSPANLAWAAENGLPHPSDAPLANIQNLGGLSDLGLSSLVDQRVSTISTSSTTSGIVSDRVLSLDSEDEGRDTVIGHIEHCDLSLVKPDGKKSKSPVVKSCDLVDGATGGRESGGKTPEWSEDTTDGPIRSENVEESDYWYACDDDASDAGSTGEHCSGAMCECRRVRSSSPDLTQPHVCTLSEDTLRAHSPSGHNKVPSGISESSSLVVSVGNTQDSDCHSVFHGYLSSEDSTKAQKFYLDEPQCISSEQSTLTKKDSKDLSVIINNALINQRTSPIQTGTLPRSCHSQSGTLKRERKEKESPLGLDLTVQSAVPSGGTYPRRSTISSTFDTDSDYVEFSPADTRQLFTSYDTCQHRIPLSKPESQRKKIEEKEKPTTMVFGSHTVPRNVAMATITPVPLATKGCAVAIQAETVEKGPIEAQARFIRSKPTIIIQQAHGKFF